MNLLSSQVFEFIVATSIAVIACIVSIMTLWISRRQAQLTIDYEAIAIEQVENTDEAIKDARGTMQVVVENDSVEAPCLLTFKIWNSGSQSILLKDESNPLIIIFDKGHKVLGLTVIEKSQYYIEVAPKLEEEKVLLLLPVLEPGQSLTFQVLLSHYINYNPVIYAQVTSKRTVRANNRRSATELTVVGIIGLLMAGLFPLFMFYLFGSFSYGRSPDATIFFIIMNIGFLLMGIISLITGQMQRRMAPYPFPLHSTVLGYYFKAFVRGLPFLIILGALAIPIYAVFGIKGVGFAYFALVFFTVPFSGWWSLYAIVTKQLQKRQKAYNAKFVGVLTGIPSLTCLTLEVILLVYLLLHWL